MGFIKKNQILILIIILVVIVGSGFFIIKGKSSNVPAKKTSISEDITAKSIKPEEIGLVITPRADKKAIFVEISKTEGIASIEYEVNYNSEGDIPRGAIGTIDIKSGEKIKREILLGTCSRNVCKYDAGVTEINFVARINFSDGTVGKVEQKVEL